MDILFNFLGFGGLFFYYYCRVVFCFVVCCGFVLFCGMVCFCFCVVFVCWFCVCIDNYFFNILKFIDMEIRIWIENGIFVIKEKMVVFLGYCINCIVKFMVDCEKFFREVVFDMFVVIESYCIKKGYDIFLLGMCEGFDFIVVEEVLNFKKRYLYICLKCVVFFKG